jgi:hypothetical protein
MLPALPFYWPKTHKCCLIHSIFELGIQASFWDQDELESPEEAEAEADSDIEALAWV